VQLPPFFVRFLEENVNLEKLFLKAGPGLQKHLDAVDVTPILKHHHPRLSVLKMDHIFTWKNPCDTMLQFMERQKYLEALCFYGNLWPSTQFPFSPSATRLSSTAIQAVTHLGVLACNLCLLSLEQAQRLLSLKIELTRGWARDWASRDVVSGEQLNSLQVISVRCCNLTVLDVTFPMLKDLELSDAPKILGSLRKLEKVKISFTMAISKVPNMVRSVSRIVYSTEAIIIFDH
jgi:hypothetical protein